MSELNRREFIKNLAVGGALLGLGGIMVHKPLEALASGNYDIGQCKSVRVKCVSELGWFDTMKLGGQMKAAGGPKTSQWIIPWDPANAAWPPRRGIR